MRSIHSRQFDPFVCHACREWRDYRSDRVLLWRSERDAWETVCTGCWSYIMTSALPEVLRMVQLQLDLEASLSPETTPE